ncbi:MAG TPA: D-alanyl-D-alanine carboxypeptidase family protein [Ktedonobacterales bacterium]
MVAHRHEKRRFQLDVPQPPQQDTLEAPLPPQLPIKLMIKPRRKRRRFHIGPPDVSPWRALPFQVVIERRRPKRQFALTLAHRRQLQRVSLVGGVLAIALVVVITSVLLNPSTHDALFPPPHVSASSAALSRVGPYTAFGSPIHYDGAAPYTSLQTYTGANASPAPDVQAQAAFVFDPQSGTVYFQKNADASYPAASLTKIMTLLLAVDSPQLDQTVTVGSDAAALVNSENSYMDLSAGEQLTVRELLYGLIVAGGNDAALAIADAVGGDEATFVMMMNTRAVQLGLTHTHFVSADGVDSQNVTSASDMAKLSAIVMQRPGVADITSAYHYTIAQTATHKQYKLQGGNDLLPGGPSPYAGVDGVKTGYTADALYCMAVSAHANGRTLIGIFLGEPSVQARDTDAHALLDWAFAQPS